MATIVNGKRVPGTEITLNGEAADKLEALVDTCRTAAQAAPSEARTATNAVWIAAFNLVALCGKPTPAATDSYCLNVVWLRSHSEDDDVLTAAGKEVNPVNLIAQFCQEIQGAMDELGSPAGHFKVTRFAEGEGMYAEAARAIHTANDVPGAS